MQKWKRSECEKMLEKWLMTVAAKIDDMPVLFKFFFMIRKTK